MTETPSPTLPADDPRRMLTHARADDVPHISVAGDTYSILVSGLETAGRYCLIDMHVPPGGGPPPHRHDFEEMFTMLEGEIEFVFRGRKTVAKPGDTLNIPANAPHAFTNASQAPARMLCLCAPAGQEEFFVAVGVPVSSRIAPPPEMDETARSERMTAALALAPRYRTEMLKAP